MALSLPRSKTIRLLGQQNPPVRSDPFLSFPSRHLTTSNHHESAITTMATAAPAPLAAQSYGHHGSYRHHPYASPAASSSSSSSRKWQSQPQLAVDTREPPSPPRSRRDNSETPSLGLGVAFGGAPGGKWWDEELVSLCMLSPATSTHPQPTPPSSLTSILDSFRRSGEGDRELLLSILGAKKAEEEVRRHPIPFWVLAKRLPYRR